MELFVNSYKKKLKNKCFKNILQLMLRLINKMILKNKLFT